MNDKKERYISSELSDKTQLSVLRSIVGWGYEKIRHSLGRPGQLERAIASGELIPCPLKTPVDTLWTRSVIYWQDWISPSWIPSDSRQCTIDFYKPGYYRGLERCHLVVPEVQNLISKEDIPHFSCDITDIQGISASKSEMYDIGDICKRAARTVLTGMCYSVGSATRQGSSSPTRFIGQSAMTSRT